MGELVNLNRARKAKARAADKAVAQANRAAHGRTKTEKLRTDAAQAAIDRTLDGAKRED